MTFKSERYVNLRVALPGGRYAQFDDFRFTTDEEGIIQELLKCPSYGKTFVSEGGYFVVDHKRRIVEIFSSAYSEEVKYPPELTKKVSIIIGTFKNPKYLEDCLKSLTEHTPRGYQLILVCQEPDKKTKEIAATYKKKLGKDMVLIENKVNLGFSEFNNQAVKYVSKKYVLYLNDDTVLRPFWLESMVYLMETTPGCGAVGKSTFTADLKPFHMAENYISGEVECVYGYCMLVRREDAHFDERYKVGGWEDIDLCTELKAQGKKIFVERCFPIVHTCSVTTNKFPDKIKIYSRNQSLFNSKWKTRVSSMFVERAPEVKKGGIKIDIGAGNNPRPGYKTVDLYTHADIKDDITRLENFADGSVAEAVCFHLLEHLPDKDVKVAINQVYRVLTKGGRWTIEVPDLVWVLEDFIKTPEGSPDKWKWKLHTIFGHQAHEGEYHKTGFSLERLRTMLLDAGFVVESITSSFSKAYNQNVIDAVAVKA